MQCESPFPPPFPTRISIYREICQTRLARIKTEHKCCKEHALITIPSLPHHDCIKMPYLNQMYEKKAVERYA